MIRAIRGLAVAGLVAVALAMGMVYIPVGGWPVMRVIPWYVPPFAFETGRLLGFSAGVLALARPGLRKQRRWATALMASLVLNGYGTLASQVLHVTFEPISFISYGLATAAPALVALAYTFRAARSAPKATAAIAEQGNLDIRIEPIGHEQR